MRRRKEHLLSIGILLGNENKAGNKINHVPALMGLMASGACRQVKKSSLSIYHLCIYVSIYLSSFYLYLVSIIEALKEKHNEIIGGEI